MHYFFIIIIVTILVSALYFLKSLDEKVFSEDKKREEEEKIEDEIFQSLKDEIKDFSTTEAKERIERAVRDQGYLEEDWQIDSAVKRIKKKKDESHLNAGNNEESEEKEKFKRGWKIMILGLCVEIGGTILFGETVERGLIIVIIGGVIIFIGLMEIDNANARESNK